MILLILFLPIIMFLLLVLIDVETERKHWNNGICRECGEPFECFDINMKGERGYKCKNGHYTWVSYYDVDKK